MRVGTERYTALQASLDILLTIEVASMLMLGSLCCMDNAETQRRIEANLAAVRDYLKKHFPDYAIIETSGPSLYHKFVVTNDTLHKRHRLRVELARLSNRRNTGEWQCGRWDDSSGRQRLLLVIL